MTHTFIMTNIPHPYYKHLVAIDRWCNKNCLGKWWHGKVDGVTVSNIFNLEDDADALAFKLVWL